MLRFIKLLFKIHIEVFWYIIGTQMIYFLNKSDQHILTNDPKMIRTHMIRIQTNCIMYRYVLSSVMCSRSFMFPESYFPSTSNSARRDNYQYTKAIYAVRSHI